MESSGFWFPLGPFHTSLLTCACCHCCPPCLLLPAELSHWGTLDSIGFSAFRGLRGGWERHLLSRYPSTSWPVTITSLRPNSGTHSCLSATRTTTSHCLVCKLSKHQATWFVHLCPFTRCRCDKKTAGLTQLMIWQDSPEANGHRTRGNSKTWGLFPRLWADYCILLTQGKDACVSFQPVQHTFVSSIKAMRPHTWYAN